ncbi:hypothetical protein EGT81_19245 [Alcaligenes faecalis]|uniref:hypothetical protein n=1 Tax=Alcaligenes faecalis TaxID=511 RepID=UPI000F67D6A8|nr:hypothetical protein [Alcaligenes faecalis]RSE57575.1 hypothetical protein EGT81_19245 [Alcaligenes faecalis]
MIHVQQRQTITLRIWNGHDFKKKIPDQYRDNLLKLAMYEVNLKVIDGFREGRFELSMEAHDLSLCSWQALAETEVTQ